MANFIAGAPGLLETYRPQGATPFPQGAGYGTGVAANTLVNSLIAKMLIDEALSQQGRENALAGLGALSREPGALRTAGGPLFQQAGLNIDTGRIPQSKEEMTSSLMQAGVDTLSRMQGGEISPESLSMSDLVGLHAVAPELAKHIFDIRRLQRSWELAGGLMGQPPTGAAPPVAGAPSPPPAAPSAGGTPLFGPRVRTTRQIGVSPTGGPDVSVSTVTEPPTKEEMELGAIEQVRPGVESEIDQLLTSGRLAMPQSWLEAQISPEDFRSAHVTRKLQQRLPSVEVRGPKLAELAKQVADFHLAKSRESAANARDAMTGIMLERLDLTGKQLELSQRRLEQMISEGNVREAAREKSNVLQAHRTKIEGLRSLIGLEESAMRQQLLIDPNIRNTDPRLRDLYKQYTDAVAEYSRAAGMPVGSTQPLGALPNEWFNNPVSPVPLPTPRGIPPAPGTPPTTGPSLQQIIQGGG